MAKVGASPEGHADSREIRKSSDAESLASSSQSVPMTQSVARDNKTNDLTELNDRLPAENANPSRDTRRVGGITPASIQPFVRDCPGQVIPDCAAVSALAKRIAHSGGDADDGWPEWMESEIQASLTSVAQVNRFIEHGAKCNVKGCVFYYAGETSREIFETGFTQQRGAFESWLAKQPWTDQLAENGMTNGSRSILAWRVIGTDYSPFVVWYVVRRIPQN